MFSGDFWKYNENKNWLDWNINSYCTHITWVLTNEDVLIISSMVYGNTNTWHYETEERSSTRSFSRFLRLTWNISKNNILMNNWSIHRQLDEARETWFVIWTWNTKISYNDMNDSGFSLLFNQYTIDPSNISPIWNELCWHHWCLTWTTIYYMIIPDKWLLFYINDRLISNYWWEIWDLNYNFYVDLPWHPWENTNTNCPYYYINWNWTIWKYKQELSIKKPSFNYRNPNRKQFIFPYYN